MPPGSPAGFVTAALCGCQHVALVLNCAGAQQDLPVRAPSSEGERRGHHNKVYMTHGPVHFREPQVITYGQAYLTARPVKHLRRVLAGADGIGFRKNIFPVIKTKQVDLVVPCLLAAVRPKHQTRVIDRKSTRLNSSHVKISYAVFCLKKKNTTK